MVSKQARDRMTYVCVFMFIVYIVFYFVWQANNSKDEKGESRRILGIPVDGICTYGLSDPRKWDAWVGIVAAIVSCCIMCSMVYFFYRDNSVQIHKALNNWDGLKTWQPTTVPTNNTLV
jgi:hypothetical protein